MPSAHIVDECSDESALPLLSSRVRFRKIAEIATCSVATD